MLHEFLEVTASLIATPAVQTEALAATSMAAASPIFTIDYVIVRMPPTWSISTVKVLPLVSVIGVP